MLRYLLSVCLISLALASTKELEVSYTIGDDTTTMSITVDSDNKTIFYHVQPSDAFEEVEMLEDYREGYLVSKIVDDGACFVQPLTETMESRVKFIESKPAYTIKESVNTTAMPMSDDDREELGPRCSEFCDGLSIYELVFDTDLRDDSSSDEDSSDEDSSDEDSSDEDSSEEDGPLQNTTRKYMRDSSSDEDSSEALAMSPGRRQVSVTFTKCILLCFIAKCFSITLTIPTGASVLYLWIFG